jgi:hypothetical protein
MDPSRQSVTSSFRTCLYLLELKGRVALPSRVSTDLRPCDPRWLRHRPNHISFMYGIHYGWLVGLDDDHARALIAILAFAVYVAVGSAFATASTTDLPGCSNVSSSRLSPVRAPRSAAASQLRIVGT